MLIFAWSEKRRNPTRSFVAISLSHPLPNHNAAALVNIRNLAVRGFRWQLPQSPEQKKAEPTRSFVAISLSHPLPNHNAVALANIRNLAVRGFRWQLPPVSPMQKRVAHDVSVSTGERWFAKHAQGIETSTGCPL